MTEHKTNQPYIETLLNSMSTEMKDALYRSLWHEHVKNDIRSYMNETVHVLSEEEITRIADRYVYNGEYDCNYSYWENLDVLMTEIIKERKGISK